jgi:T5SS/PEP-CTERM-associated repeat protein
MATYLYTGHGNTSNWADPADWKGGIAPTTTDTALFLGGGAATVTAPVSVQNVMLLGAMSLTFDGAVNISGTGFCTGFMVCDDATATFAPGATLNDPAGALVVGIDDVGTFIATGTAAAPTPLTTANGTIGRFAASAGTVTLNDTTWNCATTVFLGGAGQGALNILNGSQVTLGGNLAAGCDAGSTGALTLASGGDLTVRGSTALGMAGLATITVDHGSLFTVQNLAMIGPGSTLDLAGGSVAAGLVGGWLSVEAGGQIVGDGLLTTRATGMFEDDGRVEATGGTLQIDGVIKGAGAMQIDANSTLASTGIALMLPQVTFAGAGATLSLSHAEWVTGALAGFTIGDHITMAGIDAATWNAATQTLILSDAGQRVDALHLAGTYDGDVFAVTQANGLGTISLSAHA